MANYSICNSVPDSGMTGACTDVTVLGVTKIDVSVLASNFDTEKVTSKYMLSGWSGEVEDTVHVVSPSRVLVLLRTLG